MVVEVMAVAVAVEDHLAAVAAEDKIKKLQYLCY
jgi:hypothetical protein